MTTSFPGPRVEAGKAPGVTADDGKAGDDATLAMRGPADAAGSQEPAPEKPGTLDTADFAERLQVDPAGDDVKG